VSLWLVLGAMTALAAALVAWPLLRPPRPQGGRRDYELRVYRAQLEEVARERERGLLGEREAETARLEVERRMLAADAASQRVPVGSAKAGRWAIALLIALPLLAVGLYWPFGRPDLPSLPFAERADERPADGQARQGQAQLPSVASMILRLEQGVADRPDDLEAWQRLGRAYELAGRYDDAVRARRQALALDDGRAELHAALGEALVMANGGMVTPAAAQAFARALVLDAADPRARFYRGLALLQEGDRQGALDAWVALIEDSPGDAPWLPELQRRVAALGDDLGLDPADLPTPRPAPDAAAPGPSGEQMEAAESMAPEERAAMIQDMVAGLAARLEAQPDDIDGWRRLGRSYQVLGLPQKAADAYRHVALALPDDLAAQLDYADALLAAAPDGQVPPAALEQMRRVLALDPQNPAALFYLGQAAAQAGDAAAARAHWQRLIAQVPADAPERAQSQRLLDQLPPAPPDP
jgi:cytochrome c-type biogenesis protein CcmH